MAKVDVVNMLNERVGEIDLPDEIFSAPVKEHLFWEVVKWQQARRRAGTACTRGRSEISGSTRKLFRQKGTGRARRGDIKSPVLRGGGTVFGPHPRNFSYTLPKKVRKAALISALSRRNEENHLVVIDRIELPEAKTRHVAGMLRRFGMQSALLVDAGNVALIRSGRNIPKVAVLEPMGLNVEAVLRHDHLVLTRAAVAAIEGRLGA